MAPNDTHRLPLNSLYESIDQAFLEVWETCRPFYTLTSSPDFSIDNIPPLLEDALLAQNEKIGEVAASTQPKQSTGEDIVNNEFVGAEAATPVQAACTETSILR